MSDRCADCDVHLSPFDPQHENVDGETLCAVCFESEAVEENTMTNFDRDCAHAWELTSTSAQGGIMDQTYYAGIKNALEDYESVRRLLDYGETVSMSFGHELIASFKREG